MCTTGYIKKLGLVFKNRDKNADTNEVTVIRPGWIALKTEGADYYGLGINQHSCSFVSNAVNTPEWTALAAAGKSDEAKEQFKKENEGLISPMKMVSEMLPHVKSAKEWVDAIMKSDISFMGYNIIVADRNEAYHIETYRDKRQLNEIKGNFVMSNHFHSLDHGPKCREDYPNSYIRLENAKQQILGIRSIEDLMNVLTIPGDDESGAFWRNGNNFWSVSSSIMNLDFPSLYYTAAQNQPHSRISMSNPQTPQEKNFLEMSRYIDLPTYHKIERAHPFYEEMVEEMHKQVLQHYKNYAKGEGKMKTMEFGAGTGICSIELVQHDFLELDCVELDSKCGEILSSHPEAKHYSVHVADATTYCKPGEYDLLVSVFAHDHIHFDKRFTLARNLRDNLKKGGRYIMGGEVLPRYQNDHERKKALFKYHNMIIDIALKHDRVQLCELENNALKSGLDMVGDFKRHEEMLEDEMRSADFVIAEKIKMGPLDREDCGGVYIYVFEAV